MVVTGTYDPYLVTLSILVAAFASYTALDLGAHVAAARGLARRVWLAAAAITMGGGIWSMHFVAMLAFTMPMPMSYDIGLTALSLMVAIFVTGVGFYVISRKRASPSRLVFSGLFMGLGIAAILLRARAAAIIARVRPINRAGQLLGGIGAVLALLFDQREDLLFGLS
jgi:NO-binding membrane sensor protein with MHYT domain